MTQWIAPNMAAAMQYSNRQGMMPSNQYSSGILSMAEGGLARKPYLFGGIILIYCFYKAIIVPEKFTLNFINPNFINLSLLGFLYIQFFYN